jgi:hypothetical protein
MRQKLIAVLTLTMLVTGPSGLSAIAHAVAHDSGGDPAGCAADPGPRHRAAGCPADPDLGPRHDHHGCPSSAPAEGRPGDPGRNLRGCDCQICTILAVAGGEIVPPADLEEPLEWVRRANPLGESLTPQTCPPVIRARGPPPIV